MDNFSKGFLIGLSIAAPVGPIGLLCLRRSITDGRLAGFFSGLGAATADAFYGIIAGLGLTTVTTLLIEHRASFQTVGGGLLLYLGITTMRMQSPPNAPTEKPVGPSAPSPSKLFTAYISTFFLTLSNPATILSFIGVFAGLGIGGDTPRFRPAFWLVSGVFVGSSAWWLTLSTSAGWFASRINSTGLRWVNRAAGGLLAGFGVWQLAQAALGS